MSIEKHDGRMELEHFTKSVVRMQCIPKSARIPIFFGRAGWFLGSAEDRLYPFRTDTGGS
jgi:hypothetical protein